MSFIDERVVKMVFDSAKFEQGISKTMGLLDKFQNALLLKGASTGLDNLQKTISNFNMSGLTGAVDTVSDRFTTLGIIGTTALIKITNQAIDAGERLLKSLTVDQIAEGWKKFGDKTTAVGTLVSQGNELEFVNDQMDRLNWFTDETSYNFTDMASNIAKFTATGKGLEESVTMMQGIALWAAASGQNAGTASRAMYQLSQAMGSGVMRKEDWKSIQNTSMDTDEFRQIALDTAVALGKLKKTGEDTYKSLQSKSKSGAAEFKKAQFADSLTEGAWFDSDVMEAVYKKYGSASEVIREFVETNDQGIDTASEAIKAIEERDKALAESEAAKRGLSIEETTKALIEEGKILDPLAIKWFKAGQEARTFSDVIDSVKDAVSTQFMNMFQNIFGNYEEAKTLWTDLANSLWDMFAGPLQQVNDMLGVWNKLGGRTHFLDALKNGWEAILALTDPIRKAFENIFPSEMTAGKLYQLTKRFEEFTSKLQIGSGVALRIRRTFEGVFSVFDIIGQVISAVARTIGGFLPQIGAFAKGFLGATGTIGGFITEMAKAAKESDFFYNSIQKVIEFVSPAVETLVNILTGAIQAFEDFTGIDLHIPTFQEFSNAITNVRITLDPVIRVLKSGADGIHNFFEALNQSQMEGGDKKLGIFEKIGEIIGKLAKILGPVLTAVKNAFGKFLDYFSNALDKLDGNTIVAALGGGLFAFVGLKIKDFVDNIKDKLKPLEGIKESLSSLKDSLLDTFGAIQSNLQAGTLLKIAVAIGILAAALIALAGAENVGTGIAALGGVMMELLIFVGVLKAIEKLGGESESDIGKITTGLIKMAIAVSILSKAVLALSKLKPEEMAIGLSTVAILLIELGAFAAAMQNYAGGVENASKGMIQMSAALLILSVACKVFATMSWEQIGKGLAGVGVLLLEIGAFAKLVGDAKHIMATGVAMVAMAAALTILTGVLFIMGKAANTMGTGLLVLAGLLIELGLAVAAMNGSLVGAAAMLVVAAAILILTPALIALGACMTGDGIARALITLAGSLAVLGVAAFAFGAFAPAILLGAAALSAFSAAVLLAGAAIAVFGVGLTVFVTSVTAMGALVGTAFGLLGQAILSAIGGFVTSALQSLQGFIGLIIQYLPGILEAGKNLILALLEGIRNNLPQILQTAVQTIQTFVLGVIQFLPQLIQTGILLMTSFINGMANGIRDNQDAILGAVGNLVSSLIELVITGVQGLVRQIPGVGEELANKLEGLKDGVRNTLAPEDFEDIAQSAANSMTHEFEAASGEIYEVGGKTGEKFGEGLGEKTDAVETGAKNLTDTMNNSLGSPDVLSMLSDTGGTDIQEWLNGAGLKTDDIETMMKGLAGTATDNLGNGDGSYTTAGSDAVLGFISGMGSHDSEVSAEAQRIANLALDSMKSQKGLDEHSPSKKTYKIGIHGGKGLILGLESTEKGVKKASGKLANAVAEGLEGAVDAQVGILDYAGKAVEEFNKKWSATQEWDDEVDGINFATDALEALALQLYETSIATEDAEAKAKRAAKTQVEVLQDVKAAFMKTRDEFKNNLDGQINMFKMFDYGDAVKSGDMVERFESNLRAMTEFSDALEELAERGIDKGLLQNIAKRGPSALGEIKAFIQATDEEFDKLNKDWVKQGEILDEVSDRYMSTLAYAMAGGEEAFTHVLDPETGEDTGKTFLEATLAGMRESVGINLQEFEAVGEIAAQAVSDGLSNATSGSESKKKTKDAATSITDNVTNTVDTNIKKEDGATAGYRLCEGIAEGIRNGIDVATNAAEELALKVIETVNNALGIASPSRVFAQIGYYSDEGLAQGFTKYGSIVKEAAADTAFGAVDEMSGVFGRIADMIDGTIDLDPTIRPVLDLTNLQYGASQIGGLLGLNDPYALNATASLSGIQNDATLISGLTSSLKTAIDGMKSDNEIPPVTINIYATENQDAEDIANYTAWKLNHDVFKRRAVHGGV